MFWSTHLSVLLPMYPAISHEFVYLLFTHPFILPPPAHPASHPALAGMFTHSFTSVAPLPRYSQVFPIAHSSVHPLIHRSQTFSPSRALTTHYSPTHPPFIYHPPICPSISPFIYPFIYASTHLSVYLSIHLSIHPFNVPLMSSPLLCYLLVPSAHLLLYSSIHKQLHHPPTWGPAIITHRTVCLSIIFSPSSSALSLYPNQELSHCTPPL